MDGRSIQDKLVSLLHRLDRQQELNQFVIWLEDEKGKCVAAQTAAFSKLPTWDLIAR